MCSNLHFKTERWDASQTCAGIFTKGILWLEAYENHLQTGSDIARNFNQLEKEAIKY